MAVIGSNIRANVTLYLFSDKLYELARPVCEETMNTHSKTESAHVAAAGKKSNAQSKCFMLRQDMPQHKLHCPFPLS